MTIRVLIADDHPAFRAGLRAIFDAEPDVEVVAEAADGAEAITFAAEHIPDVVLMDLLMPNVSGADACREIVAAGTGRVVMLTMSGADESVFSALRSGASGYVVKDGAPSEMALAVRTAAAGGAFFGPAVAERLSSYFNRPGDRPVPFPELTNREREVVQLIAQGLPNSVIARQLSLHDKTVRNHVSNILGKLGERSRAALVARARDAGLGRKSGSDA